MGYGIKGRNRMLRSVSEKRQSVRDKPPEAREGTDGSKTIGKLSKGLFQFVKIGPKWFSSRFNEKPLTLKEEINETISNISFRDHKTDIFGDVIVKGKSPEIAIVADGTEDASIQFVVNKGSGSEQNWQWGIDQDDSSTFKLDAHWTVGQSTAISWDTSKNMSTFGDVYMKGGKEFKIYDSDNTNYVGFQTPATGSITSNSDYTLPGALPGGNRILQSDASGNLTWVSQSGGADGMGDGFVLEDGDGTEVTIDTNKEVKFVEGNGIDINWTNTSNGTDADPYALTFTVDHDAADNFVPNEHIDWTASSAGTIHATNYTNTTYSEATSSAEGLMSTAHHDKLDGIETGATADQNQADINGLAITTTGALNSGSITSGFGNIDIGSSTFDTTGAVGTGALTSYGNSTFGTPGAIVTATNNQHTLKLNQELNTTGDTGGGADKIFRFLYGDLTTTGISHFDYVYFIDMHDDDTSKFSVTYDGAVTAAGTVTSAGFTTTGTWTFDEHSSGTVGIQTVQDSGTTFADNDTSLMTAAAIADKIEAYGYSTTTGDITGVDLTGGTGISIDSETNTSSGNYSSTITCNLEGTELKSTGETGGTKFLREDGDNSCSWQTVSASAMTIATEASDTSCFLAFFTNNSGSLQPKVNNNLKLNSSNGNIQIGGDLDIGAGGNSDQTIKITDDDGTAGAQGGGNLTIRAGDGISSSTQVSGGDLILQSGDGAGTEGGGADGTIIAQDIFDITDTTDSSNDSGDTGALRCEGGASIAKKLYVGDTIVGTSTITSSNGVCGGPNTWSFSTGGYAALANTTTYYMTSYRGDETWANSRSSHLSASNLSYLDLPGAEWIAPAAGTVTRLQISYRQTGATDNVTFYIYKVSLSDDTSGLAITEIANQSIAVGSTTKQYFESLAISSSNTIAQNDGIYVMIKKDANTARTYSYFNVTVSGEYS